MIPAVSALGPQWNVGSVGSLGSVGSGSTASTAGALGVGGSTNSGGFSGALSSALNSLETTQANATTASQQLATGQLSDPTQAITAVENASLSMDLAAQVSGKLINDVNTVFQTQI